MATGIGSTGIGIFDRRRLTRMMCAAVLSVGTATPGVAKAETTTFDIYLAGIKAGSITVSMAQEGGRYAASGRARASGVVGAFADFKLEAEVSGRKSGGTLRPDTYRERVTERKKEIRKTLSYTGGVPRFSTTEDPESHWLDPAAQSNTLDPMSTIWEMLRNRSGNEVCSLNAVFFDGARKGRVSARSKTKRGDQVTCAGTYERLGGFSRKELRSGTQFPMTFVYEPDGDGWALARVDVQSSRGRAQFIRR